MADKVTKGVLSYDTQNRVVITPYEVPSMFPINMMIGKVGLHDVDLVTVSGFDFLCTYDALDASSVLVSKVNPNNGHPGFINLTDDDVVRMDEIAKRFLKKHASSLQ